jgi:hypothetical protein
MWNMTTSLSYTSNLYATIEARTATPLHGVYGMPVRAVYEADQGWDELFAKKAKAPVIRRGATAFDEAAQALAKRGSTQERPEEHSEER